MRLCRDMGIKCAALFDGDKKAEIEPANKNLEAPRELPRFFCLEKHRRTDSGRENEEIIKPSIF